MADIIQRTRMLLQQRPWLILLGGFVLLLLIGPLLFRLVLLLALLLIPVGLGVMIGWQLRSDPGSMSFLLRWREQCLDGLATVLETVSRWVMHWLSVLQHRKSASQPPSRSQRD